MAEFEKYLSEKLTILNVDCDTYLDYIQEILKDEDQSQDEILEMIQETLEASSDQPLENVSKEIVQMWKKLSNSEKVDTLPNEKGESNLNEIFNKQINIAQKQTIEKKGKSLSKEEDLIKQSLMMRYSQISDEEIDDSDEESSGKFGRNENVQNVANQQKLQREKRKEEAMLKKEKDKVDLEIQKLKKIERKENEKKRTQKKERSGK